MLKTTPFHPRTASLCVSHSWRRWAGYVAASSYELSHEREYHSIRSSAALFDISPLYKYRLRGPDAARLLDRVTTRDVSGSQVGQVLYTGWCDGAGKLLDDGTVARLGEALFRMTSADPNLRWLQDNALGLEVEIEDISESVGALSLQGPSSKFILQELGELPPLKYFRLAQTRLRGIPVSISRTGYTGDLGYEIWVSKEKSLELWDALMDAGRGYGITPAGMLALDVARIEAGLLLIEVDFFSSRKALIPAQQYSPFEMGLGRLVQLEKRTFVGQSALRKEHARGPARQVVGMTLAWEEVEALYEKLQLPPQVPATASRVAVPVYRDGAQVGKATSTTWSPVLKKMIALGTVERGSAEAGSRLEMEVTVEAVRHRVRAVVAKTPFFSPARKTAPINS